MNSRCTVLYSFEHDRNKTHQLFKVVSEYSQANIPCEFRYAGYYDESYKDKYGKIATVQPKIEATRPDRIVNFTLNDDEVKSKKRLISVEYNVSRPVILTLLIPANNTLDLDTWAGKVSPFFRINYGFTYIVDNYQWPTAYAFGDWQHIDGVKDNVSLAKADMQRWSAQCEKISNGYFRDIYQVNFLTSQHLSNSVSGKSLEDVIAANGLGQLTLIQPDLYSWKLDATQLRGAHEIVKNAGLLI